MFHLKTISFELHLKTISVEFHPKDAIAPIAPFVAMTMGDGRGCEGAPEHVNKTGWTVIFYNRNTKRLSTKRSTIQSIATFNDQIV